MEQTARVEGHVFNLRTGVPLAGARIDVFHVNPLMFLPAGPAASVYSDANGFYSAELGAILAGSWFPVQASCSVKEQRAVGGTTLGSRIAPPSGVLRRDLHLDMTRRRAKLECDEGADRPSPSNRPQLHVATRTRARVEGYVYNLLTRTPIEGAQIEIWARGGPIVIRPRPAGVAVTDANGFYSIALALDSRADAVIQASCMARERSASTSGLHPIGPEIPTRRDLFLDLTRRPEPVSCAVAPPYPPVVLP